MAVINGQEHDVGTVVFDLFGTMVFIHNKTNPYGLLFDSMTQDRDEQKKLKLAAMSDHRFDVKAALSKLQQPARIDEEKFQRLLAREIASSILYPETMAVLQDLKHKGYRLGCISNLAKPYVQVFTNCGLSGVIDFFIPSCNVKKTKYSPEIFKIAKLISGQSLQKMLFVGDNVLCDYQMPIEAGMQAIFLNRPGIHELPHIRSLTDLLPMLPAIR